MVDALLRGGDRCETVALKLVEGNKTPVVVVDSHGRRFLYTALDVRLADPADTNTTIRQSRRQRLEEWLQFTGGKIVEPWMWLIHPEQLPEEAVKLDKALKPRLVRNITHLMLKEKTIRTKSFLSAWRLARKEMGPNLAKQKVVGHAKMKELNLWWHLSSLRSVGVTICGGKILQNL